MSLYEKLPTDVLMQFYYEIQKNIERGILTERMHVELALIDEVAAERGITIIHSKELDKRDTYQLPTT